MSALTRTGKAIVIIWVAIVALFVLLAVTACNTGGDSYQYPQDTSHGYYDVHHHYHYYPKYRKGSKYYVVPSKPKSHTGSGFRRSSGGSLSGGFSRSGSNRGGKR